MPQFVADVPEVEIIDGMVHTRMGDCEWWWRPSTFRAFVDKSRRELERFDLCARGLLEFRPGEH
jgi:hypothetical protein